MDKIPLSPLKVFLMTSIIEDFVKKYEPNVPLYNDVASIAEKRCREMLDQMQISGVVTSRAKRPEKVKEKLEKRNKYRHYTTEQDLQIDTMDLAGVRIALYYPHQQHEVLQHLEKCFNIRDIKLHGIKNNKYASLVSDKKVTIENRESGYRAVHLHVELGPETLSLDQHCSGTTVIEIQLTSLLMHIWSEVEHELIYKNRHGRLSTAESRLLDGFGGSVRVADALLDRLKASVMTRKKIREMSYYGCKL